MENRNIVHQSTYQYKKPFRFMGAEYTDSRSLAEAFIENWDVAISVVCRVGHMEGFWKEYVKEAEGQSTDFSAVDASFYRRCRGLLYAVGWCHFADADARFPLILHEIEPALGKIPFIRAEDDEARLYSFEEFGDWLLSLAADGKWEAWEWTRGDAVDEWNHALVLKAAGQGMFSAYAPETKEAEEKFLEADEEQRSRCLKELALKLVKTRQDM